MSEIITHESDNIVLVIDDMEDVGETVRRICRSLGVACEYMPSGESLPKILRYAKINAVIADIMMPDEDGYHVMKEIADYDRHLPILMMTGGEAYLLHTVEAMAEIYHLTRVLARPKPIQRSVVKEFLVAAQLIPNARQGASIGGKGA